MISVPEPWAAIAFNTAPDSRNEIHSDRVAQQYGFKGGLVPGVTVSAYLAHPAVQAWGMDFLERGQVHAAIDKPLYDDYRFQVDLTEVTGTSYRATLTDQEGTQCANGYIDINPEPVDPPTMRGDPLLAPDQQVPEATRSNMERLREDGMYAFSSRWGGPDTPMPTYLKDPQGMPWLLSATGAHFANMSYLLGLTNFALAGNTYMNPWIHLQTDSQNYAAVPAGSDLITECAIADLFEKKGHQFVDLDVNVFFRATARAAMTARLRAIYRLRGV